MKLSVLGELLREAAMEQGRSQGIEVAIGPHPARPAWRVLRVTYETPAHDARVLAALTALFAPAAPPRAEGPHA